MPLTPAQHQKRWTELCRDPALRDLPYKVETNERGQLLLTPATTQRSLHMSAVHDLLREHAPGGGAPPSYAIATPQGVKVPDVVWASPKRERRMDATGDPTTLAPEICVEVMTQWNSDEEIQEKRELYLQTGTEEVWIVGEEGGIRFFGEEEMEGSRIAPACPSQL